MNQSEWKKMDDNMKTITEQYANELIKEKTKELKISFRNGFDIIFRDRKRKR